MNLLESLKRYSTIVADTGDIEAIAQYKPQDATTNPSLLNQAARKPQYEHLVDDALQHALHSPGDRAERTAEFGPFHMTEQYHCLSCKSPFALLRWDGDPPAGSGGRADS